MVLMLPSEIITNILYHLPSKSVGRFRCVSKEWLSLLTDSQFIKTHQNTLNRNHLIFIRNYYESYYSHPFHHPEPVINPTKLPFFGDDHGTLHGSCDGLVLVSHRNEDRLDRLVLLNPTTKESLQLPESGFYHYEMNPKSGKTEIKSTHRVGYDSLTDDYKVISLTSFRYFIDEEDEYLNYHVNDDSTIHVSLYSLRNKTWRRLSDCPKELSSCCLYQSYKHGIYLNGFLHWVIRKPDNSKVIVAFSFVDECFSEFPSANLSHIGKLAVFGGKLGHYFLDYDDVKYIKIWLMNEYGVKESWTKLSLDIFNNEYRMVNPMIFYDNGKIRVASKGVMLIYDLEKRSLSKNVYVWMYKWFTLLDSYVESLVSPTREYTSDELADSFVDQDTTDAELTQELADSFMDKLLI